MTQETKDAEVERDGDSMTVKSAVRECDKRERTIASTC